LASVLALAPASVSARTLAGHVITTTAHTNDFRIFTTGLCDNTYSAAGGTCGAFGENTMVAKAATSLTTQASGPVKSGSSFKDTATLGGGSNPTGTITFLTYGPGDTSCLNPVDRTVVTVSGAGSYESDPVSRRPVGDYRWTASYSGDANNAAASGACGDPNETSTVTQATPTLATIASGPVSVGNAIHDTAKLADASEPTGTVTFAAYGPDDPNCTGRPVFTSSVAVASTGGTISEDFTPTSPGTYRWTASYRGDENNAAASGACGDPNETATVAEAASPTALVISHRDTRVDGRTAPVILHCGGAAGQHCRGSIRLKPTSALSRDELHVAAARDKAFYIAAGKRRRVRVPLAASTATRLDRTGKAVVVAVATLSDPVRVARRALTLYP
jgi:hypothetical protein